MAMLDLLDMQYLSKSSDQNQAQLSNMYLEPDSAKGKYKVIALPMPGLTEFCDTGLSNIRAMISVQEQLYVIAANKLIHIASDATQTILGTLNTSVDTTTIKAKIRAITGASDTNHQLFLIDGTNGYAYNTSTSVATFPISNEVFVSTITLEMGGSGYLAPTVNINDSTGTGAAAVAQVSTNGIKSISIVHGGTGYTAPSCYITDATGSGASATVTQSGGIINSVSLLTGGSNYSAPSIQILDGSGSGASLTATIGGGQITGLTLTSVGSNYTSPTVSFSDSQGIGATAIASISENSFPDGAIDVESQDDYIIVSAPNSITYQISNVSDTTTWDPLNFASKFGQADGLNALLSHEGLLWLFGTQTTEIDYNSGDPDFPFTRNSTFLHYGCPARYSIAVNGNYFIFLSSNGHGGYSVFQTLPRIYYYNPAPISVPPIDTQIGQWPIISDAFGSIYMIDGHEFYELTSPSGNQTFIYDIPKAQQADAQKGAWYKRESYVNGSYGRFLGSCRAFCYGKRLVGDYNSGKIYYEDASNYTENGTAIRRQFVSPPGVTYAGGARVIFSRMQIDVETGVGSNETFTLEKSIDNGATWQLVNTYTVPAKGGRIYENRLGSSRYGMIFRITTTMNAKFAILGFQCEMKVCHN